MPQDIQAVRDVTKNYGRRVLGQGSSMDKSINTDRRFTVTLTGAMLKELGTQGGAYVPNVDIPATHVVKNSYLIVKEAFVLGGTTPTVTVGAGGNTITLSEANLETAGYVAAPTTAGQLANGSFVTADISLGLALSVGLTSDDSVGDATLVIETSAV